MELTKQQKDSIETLRKRWDGNISEPMPTFGMDGAVVIKCYRDDVAKLADQPSIYIAVERDGHKHS